MLSISRSVFRYQGKEPDESGIENELLGLWQEAGLPEMGRHGRNHKQILCKGCDLRLNLQEKLGKISRAYPDMVGPACQGQRGLVTGFHKW